MKGFCLEVSGPYACFTRPEMKVERVSYDVITPSAARAIFDAILWKPAIAWRVKRIEVLAPVRWISVRRNEVGKVASPKSAGVFIEDDRQQRAGLFLRDVKYRLHAEFVLREGPRVGPIASIGPIPSDDDGSPPSEAKYAAMFERRAKKGQCFNQPYLGCREFSAAFRLVDPAADPTIWPKECQTPDLGFGARRDLGWMLYDMDFANPADPKPQFFHAFIENGVVDLTNVEVRS
jgi:CRISPR-associated protein Cas5d